MPAHVDPNLLKLERAALAAIVTHSFTTNPHTVKTFETTLVSWNVTVPDSAFDITLKLNNQEVAAIGNKSFSLMQTTSFALSASTEHAGRLLGNQTVHVDASDCRVSVPNFAQVAVLKGNLKTAFDSRFGGSSQFSLQGNKTEVSIGDGTILIVVPLSISVPNWFDLDMNIRIQLAVSGGSHVIVSAPGVDVNIDGSLFGELLSLGCQGAVESGMEQMAQVFLSDIVNSQLVPVITQAFTDEANSFVTTLKTADPQHRTYVMVSLVLSSEGITIKACPS